MDMEFIKYTKELCLEKSAVTLGKFDGLHVGHRKLISEVNSFREDGLSSVAFTFSMHPCRLFSNREMKLIYSEEEKRRLFMETGIDKMISFPFTDETAAIPPETFIVEILIKQLHAKKIVVGPDFCFGNRRMGNVKLLKQFSEKYGFELRIVDKVQWEGEGISSSRIRKELLLGNMEQANAMLSTPYFMESEVVHGRQLGRKINMPTANQIPEKEKLLPPKGVYASYVRVGGKKYHGVTNLGVKPTVGEDNQMGAETFLFDFSGDLYGKTIKTELLSFIRPERRFDGIDALREQMEKDVKKAGEICRRQESGLL